MMLNKLVEYAQRNETSAAPKLYAEGPLRYIIELGPDGQCHGLIDRSDPSSPRTRRGTPRLLPQVQRTSGIRPLLLASPSDYTLGLPKTDKQADRAQKAHAAYVDHSRALRRRNRRPGCFGRAVFPPESTAGTTRFG